MKATFLISFVVAVTTVAQCQLPDVLWQREGAGDSSLYGSTILALGDQNDDGYNDWAVYAAGLGYAPEGSPNEPKVEFFYGGNPPATTPYMTRVAHRETEIAIRGAQTVGDLNGDGYVDWYIFTSWVDDPDQLRIFLIYLGGPESLDDPEGGGEPDLVLAVPWLSMCYSIGDFNGDGKDDLLVSDGWNDRAEIYFGNTSMDAIPDWQCETYLGVVYPGDLNNDGCSDFVSLAINDNIDIFMGSRQPNTISLYHWNLWVGTAGIIDLNGDHYGDICFARPGETNIHFGRTVLNPERDAYLQFPCNGGPQPGGATRIVDAGDFNRDGYNDIVMLTQYCPDSYYGTLTLHLGGTWLNPQPALTIRGWTAPLNLIGIRSAAGLGDINGDGIDDLAIGANDDLPFLGWRGKAVILAGDSTMVVGADEPRHELPNDLALSIYPNPFNSSTTVELDVPLGAQALDLRIFNTLGQVAHHETISVAPGRFRYFLDASSFATGLYFLHVEAAGMQQVQKLIVLK